MEFFVHRWLNRKRANIRRPRFCTHFEQLEPRTLLAGNVSAAITGGALALTGDSAGNEVQLSIVGEDLVVSGLNGTTINGSDTFIAFAAATQTSGDVNVELGGGSDTFSIVGAVTVAGSVNVEDRSGSSQLGFHGVTIQGSVAVTTGRSADSISFSGATVNGSVDLRTRGGNDVISIFDSTIRSSTNLITRRGNDAIVVEESALESNGKIRTGQGADDIAFVNSTVSGNLRGRTGQAADFLSFDGVTVNGKTRILMSKGNDTVVTQNTNQFDGAFYIGGKLGGGDSILTSDESTFSNGQKSKGFDNQTVDQTVIDSRLNDETSGAISRAAAVRELFATTDEDVTLTASIEENDDVIQSNGTILTKLSTVTVTGTTAANATVEVDADGDGQFDDGTATADANGDFSVDVTLADGAQTLQYQVVTSGNQTVESDVTTDVHRAIGSIVRFASSLGSYDIELLDTDAPITVANFKSYLDDYTNSFIHRAPADFVIQGGGFTFENGTVTDITTSPAISNEFDANNSNVRGTLSMALLGGQPDSGTSGWFINTVDNSSNLDAAQHTVFGRVIGTGMEVVDAIQGLDIFNLEPFQPNPSFGSGSFLQTPLREYSELTEQVTGTVTVTAGQTTVIGTGTSFTTELEVGDRIQIGTETFFVDSIQSNTELTLTEAHTAGATDADMFTNAEPTADNYVLFSSIAEILR